MNMHDPKPINVSTNTPTHRTLLTRAIVAVRTEDLRRLAERIVRFAGTA
jgi:hypothetical protein